MPRRNCYALKKFSEAERIADEIGFYGAAANAAVSTATAAARNGDLPHASEACSRARDEFTRTGDSLGLCECLKIEGVIERERENYSIAETILREAMCLFSECENPLGVAESEYELSLAYAAAGKGADALNSVNAARLKFEALEAVADVVRCDKLLSKLLA